MTSERSGRKRAMGALVAALVVSTMVLALQPASAGPGCGVRGFDGWTSVGAPQFGSGGSGIVDIAANHGAPDRVYVTNGSVVLRSDDAGCGFQQVYALPTVPGTNLVTSTTDSITGMTVASNGDVLLQINKAQGAGAPNVIVGPGGNLSGAFTASGLPLSGRIFDLTVGSGQVFAAIKEAGSIDSIYVSEDGGRTFSSSLDPVRQIGGLVSGDVTGRLEIEADPARRDRLWASRSSGLFLSEDAGASWQKVGQVGQGVGALRVSPNGMVTAMATAEPLAYLSFDAGITFNRVPLQTHAISVTHGPAPGDVILSTASPDLGTPQKAWVSRFAPQFSPPWGLIKRSGPVISEVEGAGKLIYARSSSGLEVYDPSILPGNGPVISPPPDFSSCVSDAVEVPSAPEFKEPAPLAEPKVTPRSRSIVIEPGESVTEPYSLLVPPTPTPLDIFFLVDVSGSMQQEICGIRNGLKGIVDAFADKGVDVWFGVGQFRGWEDGLPYEKLRAVGPPDQGLVNALYSMKADGGHNETQLTALYQAATGEGWDAGEFDDIPPGGQAGFRSEALKVMVMVTDEPFGPNDDDPSRPLVKKVLQERGIYQVGISPGTGGGRADMDEFARATGALAPSGGIDCDGDGLYDLAGGYPLVCSIRRGQSGINLVPTIVGLAGAIVDQQPASLGVLSGDDLVEEITPGVTTIDVKRENVLGYDVTFACGPEQEGRDFVVELAGHVGSRVTAPATVDIECRPKVVPVPPPAPGLGLAVAPLPVPPPNVPANAPQPRPELQSQVNPQSQAQGQAQGAPVPQRQAQPQAAFVHATQQVKEQMGMEVQMARANRNLDPITAARYAVGVGSVAMLLAFGLLRTTVKRAPVRTRR